MISNSRRTADSADDLLGQVANEFFERLAAGEQPDMEEYARRHPEIANLILEVFPALQVLRGTTNEALPPRAGTAIEPSRCRELGDFRLLRELGRGGMGVVYEAEQLSMGRRVALKVLPFAALIDSKALQRFQNEVRAVATLDHPHITAVYSVGEDRGVHYYAMQLVRGQSLATILKGLASGDRQTALSGSAMTDVLASLSQTVRAAATTTRVDRNGHGASGADPSYFRLVARIGVQAAEALQHAHDHGVVHRDIKPGNLLVDDCGKLWVTDFGLARLEADANVTMTGDVIGTLRYMSPEQALGRRGVVDHRTDVYSLGATLYELLTRQPAFAGEDRGQLLQRIADQEPRPPRQIEPRLPQELETIVLHALGKHPDERYASAEEMASDLQAYLDNRPIRAKPPALIQRAAKWTQRHTAVVWSVSVALLATTVCLAVSSALILNAWREESQARQQESDARQSERTALSQAEAQRELALRRAREARQAAYASDMRFAFELWNQGALADCRELLDTQIPDQASEDLRGVEWNALSTQLDSQFQIIGRHAGPVNDIDVFPDGRTFATAGEDGAVRVWDVDALSLVREFRLQETPVYTVGVSPDGKWLAYGAGSRDSPDLKPVTIIDAQSGAVLGNTNWHDTTIRQVRFSPDGRFLASASLQEKVSIWAFSDGTVGRSYDLPCEQDDEPEYLTVDFLDETLLLTEFHNRTGYRVWDVATGATIEDFPRLNGDDVNVNAPSWCQCESVLGYVPRIHGSEDYKSVAYFVDTSNGLEMGRVKIGESITCLAISSDGERVCIGTRSGRIRTCRLEFSGDANSRSVQPVHQQTVQIHQGAVSRLHILDEQRVITVGTDGQVAVIRLGGSSTRESPFGGEATDVTQMAAHPRSDFVAWSGLDGRIRLADRVTGEVLSESEPMTGTPTELTWSGDGTHLAAVCQSGQFCCWRVDDQLLIERLRESVRDFRRKAGLALSEDGERLYVSGDRGPDGFHVWDVSTGAKLDFVPTLYAVREIAVSPDDRLLVAAWEGVLVFDRVTGSLRHSLQVGGVCKTLLFAPGRQDLGRRIP